MTDKSELFSVVARDSFVHTAQ